MCANGALSTLKRAAAAHCCPWMIGSRARTGRLVPTIAILCRNLYSFVVTAFDMSPHVISVTEAAKSGLPKLLREVEQGDDLVVERHGKPVAAVVSMRHLAEIRRMEADLREAALLLSRAATDTGHRTDLDTVIGAFGLDRGELEAELDADLAAGRK
jgi:prevent-host-death family protein